VKSVVGQLSKAGKLITSGSQGCAQRDITKCWVGIFLLMYQLDKGKYKFSNKKEKKKKKKERVQ
jgi:hypothetical protein